MIGTGALAGVLTSSASAAVDPGIGTSYAQGFQVTPHEGSLAIGGVFDEALAGHTSNIARAQSQGLDLGAVGASIKGYNCNQPPSALAGFVPDPLQAETPSSGSTDQGTQGPTDHNADGSVLHVVANGVPYGEADATFGGQIASPGSLITVSHITSKAWSGLVNGVRQAAATVDIGSVGIANAVTLKSLHWEVLFPSGPGVGKPTSSFTVGQATAGGQALPTADTAQLASAVNQVIGQMGLEIVFPTASFAQGIQFESPLDIEVVPNDNRDKVVDPAITGVVEPNYYPIANGLENGFASTSSPYNALAPTEAGPPGSPQQQLQAALCQSDTPITVLDVTMASMTAGGYFNIGLGGVNATSGNLPSNPYQLNSFVPYTLPGSTQVIPGTAGTPGSAGSPPPAIAAGGSPSGTTGGPTTPSAPAGGGSSNAAPAPTTGPTSPAATVLRGASGPLLGIGFAVLGLLALLAGADRRLIRRTVRGVVFEE